MKHPRPKREYADPGIFLHNLMKYMAYKGINKWHIFPVVLKQMVSEHSSQNAI